MRFKVNPILTLFALIGISILIGLGTWQLQRLAWKEDLIAKIETRTQMPPQSFRVVMTEAKDILGREYMPVHITGRFMHEKESHVFGTLDGKAGWYIFTPLESAEADYIVYINRGFVPEGLKEPSTRQAAQVEGQVKVTGLLRTKAKVPFFANMVQPPNNIEKNQWYIRDPQLFAEAANLTVLPLLMIDAETTMVLSDDPQTALGAGPQGGTTQLKFSNRHMEYALTWFGLAAALLGVYLAFSLKRKT